MSYTTRINESELLKLGMTRATIAAIRQLQDMVTSGTIDLGLLESLLLINQGPESLRPSIERVTFDVMALAAQVQTARIALDDCNRRINELRAEALTGARNTSTDDIKRRLDALEARQFTASEV